MKKFLSLFICILIALSLFTACNSDSAGNSDNGTARTRGSNGRKDNYAHLVGLRGNTPANLACGGSIAREGDWIYFNQDSSLYKIRIDGTEKTRLCAASGRANISEINVMDGWVYFTGHYDDGLRRIRTDGNDLETLHTESGVEFLNVVDGWIYFSTTNGHFLSEDTVLKVYKMRIDGTNKQVLLEGKVCINLIVVGDWIYFTDCDLVYDNVLDLNTPRLFKMKTDGSEVQELFTFIEEYEFKDEFFVDNGWVYPMGYGPAIKLDGTEILEYDHYKSTLNITDEYIYYIDYQWRVGDPNYISRTRRGGPIEGEIVVHPRASTGIGSSLYICDDILIYSAGGWQMAHLDGSDAINISEKTAVNTDYDD